MDTEVIHSLSDKRCWYSLSSWSRVATTDTGMWSKVSPSGYRQDLFNGKLILSVCFRISWAFKWNPHLSRWKHFFLMFGLVLIWSSVISAENREQLATSDDNILDHGRLRWGASDSAMPQLAQKVAALSNWRIWQHLHQWPGDRFSLRCLINLSQYFFSDCFKSCLTTEHGSKVLTHSAVVCQTVVFTFSQINEEQKSEGEKNEEGEKQTDEKQKYIRESGGQTGGIRQTSSDEQL